MSRTSLLLCFFSHQAFLFVDYATMSAPFLICLAGNDVLQFLPYSLHTNRLFHPLVTELASSKRFLEVSSAKHSINLTLSGISTLHGHTNLLIQLFF